MTRPVELRGITWDHERGLNPLLATAERFAADSGIRVTWEARSLQGFADQSIPELARTYDLLVYDHPHIGEIVPTGALLPLDGLLDDAFLADQAQSSVGPSYRSYEWDGHLWALPIDAAGHVSAYRPDLLERLGVGAPETWDDVWALDELAREHGMRISLPNKQVDTIASFLTLCANAGVDPYLDDERVVDRDVARAQLSVLQRLTAASPAAAFGWNPIQLLDRMAETDEIVYCPLLFGYSNYSRPGFRRELVRFRPVPSAGLGPCGGVIGGAGLGISASCRDVPAARAYAEHVASAEVQRTSYVEADGQPGHRSAWIDPTANEIAGDFFRDTLPGLDAGYLRPRYDGALLVQNEGGDRVWEFLRDGGDGERLLDGLDALYRQSLGRT
ncbi:MAG TPA: extracellular solute-binding protein [Baekduia sp.]|nr:extracellular solute-binding protein [Baekduia sp.]